MRKIEIKNLKNKYRIKSLVIQVKTMDLFIVGRSKLIIKK